MRRTAILLVLAALVESSPARTPDTQRSYDLIVRHGTVIDGTGRARFSADVGLTGGFIAAIGDLSSASARAEIDARGLFVAPGFINIHSHAMPNALRTAANMLTQGVTTEIVNADGSGSLALDAQLAGLVSDGAAVNVGGYIGFNSAWRAVMGDEDHRAGPAELARMKAMIEAGLQAGAWGVSAGLEYQPASFAQTREVVDVVNVARPWRTNFTNHERLTPEAGYSSKAGIAETIAIGESTGLVPVITHMKVQGREQGSAGAILGTMTAATRRGHYVAADVYPYLAGLSGLGALTIPGWAQAGGRQALVARFADPVQRSRIVKEVENALTARFGGPQGVYVLRRRQELTDAMTELNAPAGETVVRLLAEGSDPIAILRFGIERDLIDILKDPVASIACDCGASLNAPHPRFYGTYPRVLGRYVREQQIMTWEQAIRKMTGLPAATIGLVDRGVLSVGMAADVTVFDPAAIVDRATYENPSAPSEGVRFVLVNGRVAVRDGQTTGETGGIAVRRSPHMPSRPFDVTRATRRVSLNAAVSEARLVVDVLQSQDARAARSRFELEDPRSHTTLVATDFGLLQTAPGWATFTGRAGDRSFCVIIDRDDPRGQQGLASVWLSIDGAPVWSGTLPARAVRIS